MAIVYEYIIRFNKPDSNGDVFRPKAISKASLDKAKAEGKIIDYFIEKDGVKVKRRI